jgi:hypothetical protein
MYCPFGQEIQTKRSGPQEIFCCYTGYFTNYILSYNISLQKDDKLLEKLRELGGVPLMSIRFNTILLEKVYANICKIN